MDWATVTFMTLATVLLFGVCAIAGGINDTLNRLHKLEEKAAGLSSTVDRIQYNLVNINHSARTAPLLSP